jgi:hypothetical protein
MTAIIISMRYVVFEVFTAVVMKSIIFWNVTPCSLLSCNHDVSEEHIASIFRPENRCIYREQKLENGARFSLAGPYEDVNTHGQNHRANRITDYTASHPRR